MLLTRPKEYELTIDATTDYVTALTAIAFAALRSTPTTLENIERTTLLAQIEPVLASGGISLQWQEQSVTISAGEVHPFDYLESIDDYDLFKYLLVLAATRQGSRISIVAELDSTVQMIVLALRRMGAEFEFLNGARPHLIVQSPISREIKYHLKRENAKIVPQLVIAMAAQGGSSELLDLFESSRFDYLFEHFVSDFQREDLLKIDPSDELERRLAKRSPKISEFKSRVVVNGGVKSEGSTISLHPDSEFAAYLAAAVISHGRGKLILRNVHTDDISSTPLSQLRRMGMEVSTEKEGRSSNLIIAHSTLKSRSVSYDQLHDYPDSVGAIALANSRTGGTAVIHSSPFNTDREEARRKSICALIRSLGIKIAEIGDGVVLEGREHLSSDPIRTNQDPVCALMAAAASLGTVAKLEVDDLSPARMRWGANFDRVVDLIAAKT
jgi:5-enolpyruvylshikimate-3-phosphate synthase